jgi:uncharacterized protein involved in propanediol utilization
MQYPMPVSPDRLTSEAVRNANRVGPSDVGSGKAFGSFGEIVQGRLSTGEDFLVTLPIDLWSTCELTCTRINGPLVIECALKKSQALLQLVLEELAVSWGYHITCSFTSDIPIGKGLGSSTADMLAALRALQEVFGFPLNEQFISRTFAAVEPHDALHYNASTAYNHRKGRLIHDFNYVPAYTIVAVDNGGVVDTLAYNQDLRFRSDITRRYDELFRRLQEAFKAHDDATIAMCATESARLHAQVQGSEFLETALAFRNDMSCLGVVATHSGTCAGFLFPSSDPQIEEAVKQIREHFAGKDVFVTNTLRLLL